MIDNDASPDISYAYGNVLRLIKSDEQPEAEPVIEPVSLAEAKTWLRISPGETTFDAKVLRGIASARQRFENWLNVSLIRRTITASLQLAPCGMQLPFSPVVGQLISVVDQDGNVIDTGTYTLNDALFTADGYSDLVVTYEAGYEVCPDWAVEGILSLLSWRWEHQGDDDAVMNIGKITGCKGYRRLV